MIRKLTLAFATIALSAGLAGQAVTLPTLDEAGLKGFNVNIWHGVYAPKGTPKAVTDKLNAALRTALKDPEFIKREEALGAVVITMLWLQLTALAILIGAEINAELEHQTAKDSTTGPDRPLGQRGAVMADTVGAPAEAVRADRG